MHKSINNTNSAPLLVVNFPRIEKENDYKKAAKEIAEVIKTFNWNGCQAHIETEINAIEKYFLQKDPKNSVAISKEFEKAVGSLYANMVNDPRGDRELLEIVTE